MLYLGWCVGPGSPPFIYEVDHLIHNFIWASPIIKYSTRMGILSARDKNTGTNPAFYG